MAPGHGRAGATSRGNRSIRDDRGLTVAQATPSSLIESLSSALTCAARVGTSVGRRGRQRVTTTAGVMPGGHVAMTGRAPARRLHAGALRWFVVASAVLLGLALSAPVLAAKPVP